MLVVGPHTQPDVGHRLRPDETEMTGDQQQEQNYATRLDVRPDHLPADLQTRDALETFFAPAST